MAFGRAFEDQFISQAETENRSVEQTLDIGWSLLRLLPESELDRLPPELIAQYYRKPEET